MLCKYGLPPHDLGHLFFAVILPHFQWSIFPGGTADFASWLRGTEALQGYVARSGPGAGSRFSVVSQHVVVIFQKIRMAFEGDQLKYIYNIYI